MSHEHSDASLALAKDDHVEHMKGMTQATEEMKCKELAVRCFPVDDPNAPAIGGNKKNVKIVHFVRHGQGFHNLMADLAKQEIGRAHV